MDADEAQPRNMYPPRRDKSEQRERVIIDALDEAKAVAGHAKKPPRERTRSRPYSENIELPHILTALRDSPETRLIERKRRIEPKNRDVGRRDNDGTISTGRTESLRCSAPVFALVTRHGRDYQDERQRHEAKYAGDC